MFSSQATWSRAPTTCTLQPAAAISARTRASLSRTFSPAKRTEWVTTGARLGSGRSLQSLATRLAAMNLTLMPWGARASSKRAAVATETVLGSMPRVCPLRSWAFTNASIEGVSGSPCFIRSMPEPASSAPACR